jgi:Flp pilus assembly protein TadD
MGATMSGEPELEDARLLALAQHQIAIQRPAEALRTLATAQHLAPVSAEAWGMRAMALHALERFDEGADAASRALAIDPSDGAALSILGECELARGDVAAAERAMLGALELNPEDANRLASYARLCVLGGQLEKGARLLAAASALDPHARSVLRGLWLVAHARGDDTEARRISDDYLAGDPAEINAHTMAGNTSVVAGDYVRARRHFVEGVRAYPGRQDLARAARAADLYTSLLFWPIRPLLRLGTAKAWFVGVGGGFLLRAAGYHRASTWWFEGYLIVCVYSWIALFLARWLKKRRLR